MKRISILCLILTISALRLFSQDEKVTAFVAEGVKLHDKGNYSAAVKEFQKALAIDANSTLALYESANTYFAMKNYDKAIEHTDKIISLHKGNVDESYVLKGSALDLLNKPLDAIATYKQGIKDYPDDYFLYYNLALTSYNQKLIPEAEEALKKGLVLNPQHASSHLLLGYIKQEQGDRTKSLLALYNFLLLEPASQRTKVALEQLTTQMKAGVVRKDKKTTNIFMNTSVSPGDDSSSAASFRAADFSLSIMEAGKDIDKNKHKTEQELFVSSTGTFLGILGELKKDNKGFWWNYYVDFFYALDKAKHIEAFCYYITQSKDDKEINTWLKKNKSKVTAFADWYGKYDRR
ncbi:MAG: tetratricopeptide repeat protein [Bacteroidetes bacterium]|nr:tetratricopeptide repeat protein [Bacteroidota bacterium]